jgi:hypothetical protein
MIKGVNQLASELALKLIEEGFDYSDIRRIVIEKTNFYKEEDIVKFEDKLYKKIEKYSQYIYVKNVNTSEEYYYHTVQEVVLDTTMTEGQVNGSIYGSNLANSTFLIQRLSFTTKELCQDKRHLFKKKIGKVDVRQFYTKEGKYMSNPLRVIDTYTDSIRIYQNARLFCDEFNIKTYNLSKYILNNWRVKGRYKLESYKEGFNVF